MEALFYANFIMRFLGVAALILGLIMGVIFFIRRLIVSPEKKKKYSKLVLFSFIQAGIGVFLLFGGQLSWEIFIWKTKSVAETKRQEERKEGALKADQIFVEFDLNKDVCVFEKFEVGQDIILSSMRVRTNQKASVKQFPVEIDHNLSSDSVIIGSLGFRQFGKEKINFLDISAFMEGSNTKTFNNRFGDFYIEENKDYILELVLTPAMGTKISPGNNSLKVTIPINQWKIYDRGDDAVAIQMPSSNISSKSPLTTTCKF